MPALRFNDIPSAALNDEALALQILDAAPGAQVTVRAAIRDDAWPKILAFLDANL